MALIQQIDKDLEEPCFAVGTRFKLMKGTPGRKQRLLHSIFGSMMIASHSSRNAQQRFCVHHRNLLEFVAPIRRYYHALPEPPPTNEIKVHPL
jgi:hypothetical protein